MKKVAFFTTHATGTFHNYQIDYLDPTPFLRESSYGSWRDLLAGGVNRYDKRRALWLAEGVDILYRSRDPAYMRFVEEFVRQYSNYDLIVLSACNPIHPEVLRNELKKPVKILGFVDDPISTYIRGIPYLWAFDGAFYVSPSYDERTLMSEALENWGCQKHFWLPLTQPVNITGSVSEEFFLRRNRGVVYVGKSYSQKMDRLIALKSQLGDAFDVYGRWSLGGCSGMLRVLGGARPFWHRVRSVTDAEREEIYLNTKIGFNMHFSPRPMETGNMRMYETALHGMMLLCDKGGRNGHAKIFLPDREAIFYDSLQDAIDKAEYFLAHPEERMEIAWNGFERAHRDYNWEQNFLKFLDWATSLAQTRKVGQSRKLGAYSAHKELH